MGFSNPRSYSNQRDVSRRKSNQANSYMYLMSVYAADTEYDDDEETAVTE